MSKSSVLIVDDSSMMRAMLSRLVENSGDFTVVGTAVDGRDAIAQARELKPDYCLLDLEMPGMDGLTALPALRAVADTTVIVVSSVSGAGSAERRACLMAGAAAIVSKPSGAISADLTETRGDAILAALRACRSVDGPGEIPA